MTKNPDDYFEIGCGRCPRGGTPDCSVVLWASTLSALRRVVQSVGLTEESKWGAPCYTYNSKIIAMIGAFRERCSLIFFKGDLMGDPENLLVKAGENSHEGRLLHLTSPDQVLKLEQHIVAYLYESIDVEKSGVKRMEKPPFVEQIPDEVRQFFEENHEVRDAFFKLTPGRQRSHLLHFNSAKQSATRAARIVKAAPAILAGKGWNER
ncbi:MAG: YdeI family protein, partial [Flavobacteriales bacterium]